MLRALRRWHKFRMKRRAAKLYPGQPSARYADNLAACSCALCGNRRKWFRERTPKETAAREEVQLSSNP